MNCDFEGYFVGEDLLGGGREGRVPGVVNNG